ncbi:FLZ-type domain-containing protein [Psidium guajava]|nr:FLZ-type domain-containing protein [Psidium guajava]
MPVDGRQSPPSLICPIPYKPALVVAPSKPNPHACWIAIVDQNPFTNLLQEVYSEKCYLPARPNIMLLLARLLSLI